MNILVVLVPEVPHDAQEELQLAADAQICASN